MPKITPGPDNFEFDLVSQFKGYYPCIDPTLAPKEYLIRGSQNVYKTSNGTLANRPGRKLNDSSTDTTIAGIKSAFVWNTSLGAILPLRIANSKLEVRSDIVTSGTYVWYTLQSSLTLTRYVFDTIWDNTLKKDFLVFVRGDLNLFRWDGGIGTISSTTSNTIVLNNTVASLGFNTTSGSVVINGTTYAYTGSSASTLTGVTGDPTGEANGSVVISAVITNANTPVSTTTFTNDFLRTVSNQLYVGSYNSRLIYVSKNTSYIDYTQSTPRVPGNGELITLDNAAKGIGVRQGKAHIFAGTSDLYIISFNQITVGSTLTEQTLVEKQNTSLRAAAYSHEFIDSLNDTLVWLSQDQQLRTYGVFRNISEPAYPILSERVADELADVDFTLGQLKVIGGAEKGDLIYIVAPNSGVVYMHQTFSQVNSIGNIMTERLWHAPFVWGISRVDVINGVEVGFSNANPQTYQLWDTGQWHDDSPSGNLPYVSTALFAYRNHGRRQGKLKFDKIFWEGYMTFGTKLNGVVYADYQGATALLTPIIHDSTQSAATSQSFFSGIVPPSLGDASLGDNPLGDLTAAYGVAMVSILDHDLVPKFRIITGVQSTDCFEYALMAYSSNIDARWELVSLGTNAYESANQAVEIIK